MINALLERRTAPADTAACNVAGCQEPRPEDMDDQPTCETCRRHMCLKHTINREAGRYSLCPSCYREERPVVIVMAIQMRDLSERMRMSFQADGEPLALPLDLGTADIEAALEGWLKAIRGVL